LHVPEGLAGERVDAALARMFGLSRTQAADLVAAGQVMLDGAAPTKSDRVHGGSFLEVRIPPPDAGPQVVPETVDGLSVVYDDDSIVVVDKPVGVAAPPSAGGTRPKVPGPLAATGYPV